MDGTASVDDLFFMVSAGSLLRGRDMPDPAIFLAA